MIIIIIPDKNCDGIYLCPVGLTITCVGQQKFLFFLFPFVSNYWYLWWLIWRYRQISAVHPHHSRPGRYRLARSIGAGAAAGYLFSKDYFPFYCIRTRQKDISYRAVGGNCSEWISLVWTFFLSVHAPERVFYIALSGIAVARHLYYGASSFWYMQMKVYLPSCIIYFFLNWVLIIVLGLVHITIYKTYLLKCVNTIRLLQRILKFM